MFVRRLLPAAAVLALACAVPSFARAQSNDSGAKAETPTFYNLVFRVIDRDGKKIVSSRSYKTSIGVAR
ncbi:MAG: hypothetical protein WCC14_04005, partial [Acidobacteriaceae bacterium]